MRNARRRSFTVEVKFGTRRQAAVIPSRITPFAAAPPRPASRVEPEDTILTPAMEARRILPSLIVPEPPQPEPTPLSIAEAPPPRRPRVRPRKLRPDPIPPAVEVASLVSVATSPVPTAPMLPTPAPRKCTEKLALDLGRGERWKRRLGRWSR